MGARSKPVPEATKESVTMKEDVASAPTLQTSGSDKWFDIDKVGFHHHGNPSLTPISIKDAQTYFIKKHPHVNSTRYS